MLEWLKTPVLYYTTNPKILPLVGLCFRPSLLQNFWPSFPGIVIQFALLSSSTRKTCVGWEMGYPDTRSHAAQQPVQSRNPTQSCPHPPQAHPCVRSLYAKSVRSVTTRRLRHTDDLDDLAPLKSQIPGNRILAQDSRQLRLLESVPLEERGLLLLGQQHVLGHELVVGDVDQQIFLEEALDLGVLRGDRHDLAGLGGQRDGGDEDAGFELVIGAVGDEFLHDRDTDGTLLGAELDPDGAAFGSGVGVGGRGRGGELFDHGFGGTGGELKLGAAV